MKVTVNSNKIKRLFLVEDFLGRKKVGPNYLSFRTGSLLLATTQRFGQFLRLDLIHLVKILNYACFSASSDRKH